MLTFMVKSIRNKVWKFIIEVIQESILIGLIIFNKLLIFGQYTLILITLTKFSFASDLIQRIGKEIFFLNKNIIKELIGKSLENNKSIINEYNYLLDYDQKLFILNSLNLLFLLFWILFFILLIIFIVIRFIKLFICEIESCFCSSLKKGKFRIKTNLTQLNSNYF